MSVPSWGIQQLLMQREEEQRRLQQAQQTMHAGFAPGGNNIFGLLAGVASAIAGKKRAGEAQGRLDENLKAIFDEQNKEAQARMEAEQRKRQEQYEDAIRVYSEKAKIDAANRPPEKLGFKERAFEMLSPQEQAAALKNEFGLGPKAGPAPSELEKRLMLAQRMGATPEQMQALVLGQSGQAAPSGYRQAEGGRLEPIPGGPADPSVPPKLGNETLNKVALLDNAIANAKAYRDRVVPVGADGKRTQGFNDVASMLGDTDQLMQSAVQDMLYVKTGASAPKEEVNKAYAMYAPSRIKGLPLIGPEVIPVERDSTAAAKVDRLITDLERMRGTITGQYAAPGAQPQGASPDAQGGMQIGAIITGPDGRRYRIIGGDPNDPDVEPVS